MKRFLLLFGILFITLECHSQQSTTVCPCSNLGLDTAWAKDNNIICHLIPVPRDTSNKENGVFRLGVVVAPSVNQTGEKPLLYLHGGPGIATLENVPRYLKSKTWELIRENRPLIFFDYRGTGYSEPALCPEINDAVAAFATRNPSVEAIHSYKMGLLKKCRSDLSLEKIDISTFNTIQFSEDAEAVRAALNIDKWNVYGVSQGTTVGLNLLRNHGDHIISVILDSPFPPNAPWLDFVRPFDTSFKVLEKNIASDPVASTHFSSIRNDFKNAVTRLNQQPIKVKINEKPEFDYNGDQFAWGIWSAMLKPKALPMVPLVLKEVSEGNDAILSEWVVAFNDPNAYGTFSELQSDAVLCYEGRPKTEADTKSALLKDYPDFSSFNLDFQNELCEIWQPKSAGNHAYEPVVSDVPVLILSGEYDPVCPPIFGEITSRKLSNSVFINVPSASHAVIHANDCIRTIAVDFLSGAKMNINDDCVGNLPKINFITSDLTKAMSDLNKK